MPRNWQIPLAPEALEFLKKEFQAVSSYTSENPGIDAKDLEEFFIAIEYPHNPLQLQTYKHFCNACFNGRVPLEAILNSFAELHDTAKVAAVTARTISKSDDGFISREDFDEFMLALYAHDPKLAYIDRKTFLQEADKNHDGKVNIEEFEQWIRNHLDAASV